MSQPVPLDQRAVTVYRRLFRYTLDHWGMFVLAIVGMIIYAITETGFAAIIKPLLDQSFVERDPDYIRLMPLAILGIFVVRGIASFASTYCMAAVGRRVVKQVRREVFEETGINTEPIHGDLIDLDIHPIPPRAPEPAHEHFDLRFGFRALDTNVVADDEVNDAVWAPCAQIERYAVDESVIRGVAGLRRACS